MNDSKPARSRAQRATRLAPIVALVLTSVLISVGLAELTLRIVAAKTPPWLAIYRRNPELPFHSVLPDLRVSIDTGETQWLIATDADGFRIGDSKPVSSECTALWLGDSFAFGHGVNYDESIVGIVGAGAPGVRQINSAAPGYGPVQYRQILENLLAHDRHFDYVYVLTYVGNDFHDCLWDKDVAVNEGVIGHQGDFKSYLKSYSRLYQLASVAFQRLAPESDSPFAKILEELSDPDAWRQDSLTRARAVYNTEMSRVQQLGREHGAQVRFVIIPTQAAVAAAREGDRSEAGVQPLLPVLQARAALEDMHAEVLDATEVLAQHANEQLYFPIDGHLTKAGNRIVAEALSATWPLACGRDPVLP